MFEPINRAIDSGFNFLGIVSSSPVYLVLFISLFYVLIVNGIIKIFTDHAEKKRLQGEMDEIRKKIRELKGPGLIARLKTRDIEKRRELLAMREANKPLIKKEYKKLNKLNKRFSWNFRYKPMLFYLPLVLLLLRPIRTSFLQGVITQPVVGLIGLVLISIIVINYAIKRVGKAPLIEHKFHQFIFSFAGIALLFKSSLSIFWFSLITIFVLNTLVKKIMGTD